MSQGIFAGIDFGTTNSSIAWFDPGSRCARALFNAEGEPKTPSVVYVGPKEIIVGKHAEDLVEKDQANLRRIIRAVKPKLADKVVWHIDDRRWTSTQIAAEIIKKLKYDAERLYFNGLNIERAVFTHPATFDELEKGALRRAAEEAGFREVELLEEPIAAAVAFAIEKGSEIGNTILVYDLGGGTFDITLLKRSNRGEFRVAARPTGLKVGGEDFDRLLYDEVDRYIRGRSPGHGLPTDTFDLRLLKRCRQYKENLSRVEEPVPLNVLLGREPIEIRIKRSRFEDLIQEHVNSTVQLARDVLSEAGLDKVDALLLIGGSSEIPLIRRRLEDELKVRPLKWEKGDIAVVLGAAYWAARKWGRIEIPIREKASQEKTRPARRSSVGKTQEVTQGPVSFERRSVPAQTKTRRHSQEHAVPLSSAGYQPKQGQGCVLAIAVASAAIAGLAAVLGVFLVLFLVCAGLTAGCFLEENNVH